MKLLFSTCIALVLIFSIGCNSRRYAFEEAQDNTLKIYYGNNSSLAKDALIHFLNEAKINESTARTSEFNYDIVIGITWIQLSTIYTIDNNRSQAAIAMDNAIRIFDKIPAFNSDPKYYNNKRQALWDMVLKTEAFNTPEWKKHVPPAPEQCPI